jgi:PIN domain nuclease of toxin-antitoxin system
MAFPTERLVEKGRIKLDRPATQWIAESLRVSPMQEASLTFEAALAGAVPVLANL